MTFPKRNVLFTVNIIIPLIIGLFIYLTKPSSTYLSDFLSGFRSVLPIIRYPEIIDFYACDFLWTYSMFFCLRLALGDALKGKYNLMVITVTGVVAIILETLQLIKGVPGTFDPMDIVTELIAVTVAYLLTIIIERRFKYYEENGFS